ncbi:MAG: LTA synthase family protein [Oscillospiraceae bacterium]|nr:LTA synthase family protein [Oscillospiraceae bacterium]
MLLLAAAGVTAASLLVSSSTYRLGVFRGYFSHPLIFLLNAAPTALLMLLGWCAAGRPCAAYLIGGLTTLARAAGNCYTLSFRSDPVLFADLTLVSEVTTMAERYHLFFNWQLIAALVCFAAGFVFLLLFVRGKPGGRVRGALAAAGLLAAGLSGSAYLSDGLYGTTATNLTVLNEWSPTDLYVSRGNAYPFLYSLNEAFPTPPDGYDADDAVALLSAYSDAEIPAEQKVNIVGIMLEAFSDFSTFGDIGITPEAYSIYHALEAESYTGSLITNIFAGGTVNTERAFLTGVSDEFNWRRIIVSYIRYLKSHVYYTSVDHQSLCLLYNRQNINGYLGFDSYRFVENYYTQFTNGNVASDTVFFRELTADLLERLESGTPQFSFSVSYQGHGPYDSDVCYWGDVDEFVTDETLSDYARYILANYIASVMDTQEKLAELVETLRASEEPVVLIVFGDHKPWLGNANAVYEELGVDLDQSTEEGFYNYWSTRYLIWANDAAKAALGFEFLGTGPSLSPYFLMSHLFDLLGWDGDAYMQAVAPVYQALPVLHDTGVYITADGTFTRTLTETQSALLERYRTLQYYRGTEFTR